MDEPHRHRPANHRAWRFAPLLIVALAGCKQLGLGNSKVENPVVPPPPDRKVAVDSQTSSAKSAPPVKLDGSASGKGASGTPNAPGIEGASILNGMPSSGGDPSAAEIARQRAEKKEQASDSKGRTQRAQTASHEDDDSAGGDPSVNADFEEPDGAAEPDTSIAEDKSSEPDRMSREGNLETSIGARSLEIPQDATDDVVAPIEVEGAGANFVKGKVAATVNGVPIFCDDVLRNVPDEISRNLALYEKAVAEGKVKPEEYRTYRRRIIEGFMQQHIQQELLLQALKLKLKEEQLNGIKKQLDKVFDTEDLPAAIKKAGVTTTAELEQKLQAQGSSIDALRTASRNRQLAQQYLGTKAASNIGYDRPDVLKYYQDNLKSYAITAKAKWEQIQLKFDKNGGKEGARKKAEEVLQRLDAGEVFAVVAKECSNGPTASKGGLWPRTEQGSIKAQEVDEALFELPIAEISEPIETKTSFDIIRVIDRTPAGYERFEDVQEDIKNQLKTTIFQRRVTELLKELTEKANIEKFTDKL
jgi:parvulin-like peptidyl-prolyl isomerase